MIEITEQDGELLIDGKPVDFQAPWKVEDAIRQLRAEIAERDAQIAGLQNAVDACILQIERDQAERTRLQMLAARVVRDEPDIDAGRALIVQSERIAGLHSTCEYARQTVADLEAELARLRAQEPVAWMWNDMIGIQHTHISPTRPTWPDAGASSAMSVAINVRPLYAEPMPAPSIKVREDEIEQLKSDLESSRDISSRLKFKINKMLEILSEELTASARRRIGDRFNAELDNVPAKVAG